MLYLIATPIGNLQDITLRALDILKKCDYLLCEDTRHSQALLSRYDIKQPLKSYHEHNQNDRTPEVLEDLKNGMTIGLVSDAGTPGISDPGTDLVKACVAAGIAVSALPGPCAAISALTISGLDTRRFQFVGFLPKKAGELQKALQEALLYPGTTIFYESPHRLLATLQKIHELDSNRQLAIARELTKIHEEVLKGTAETLMQRWSNEEPRGEMVLMIEQNQEDEQETWKSMDPLEHVALLEATYQLSRNEAIKLAAKMRGVTKNTIYNLFHKA
jgi:16S rRNA (cytidine1402-2'-O)-methyltransferase